MHAVEMSLLSPMRYMSLRHGSSIVRPDLTAVVQHELD
jgi:hypothetical protein